MSFLWKSSIGRKLTMSITGLFLVIFLLFHMSMNIVAIFSTDAYNMICEFLGANWYALAATLVLAAGFVFHIIYASVLTLQNQKARGNQRYAVSAYPGVSWASRNMYILGAIVILGLVLHLFNFWAKMQLVEIAGGHENCLGLSPTDGAALIERLFAQPLYCVLYILWFAAIWFHLTHGFWSAFQTIGWSNNIWLERLKCVANVFATIIFLGFTSVVVYFYITSLC